MVTQIEKDNTTFFEFSFDEWNMGDLADFQDAVATGRLTDIFDRMAKGVKAWSYAGDPHDTASWRSLKPNQYKEIAKSFNETMVEFFRS